MNEARPKEDFFLMAALNTGRDVPADRLADSYKEILCLLSNWRECLQDDMAVLGTNPEGAGSVVGLQVQPGKVLVHENV